MSIALGNSDFRVLPRSTKAKITSVHESLLQESEKDIIWYRDNFFGKDSPRGPMAVSLICDGDVYKALVRSTTGSERLSVSMSAIPSPWWRKVFGIGPSNQVVLNAISRNIPVACLNQVKDIHLSTELLTMEERQVIRSYKFGVCYLAKGQSTEAEMMANKIENASEEFKKFLNFLGERIELKNWKGYRAGLDVSGSSNTGTHSVYTKWQGYEIMYHVACLLPHIENDPQQLERKRHIGNDIVTIVFQDDDTPFKIDTITTHQTHVIFVVQPVGDEYKFTVIAKSGVPPFTPELPEPCIIGKDAVSRDFFLHKVVNAERASYKAPSFAPKISRTRSVLLQDLAAKYLN